MVSSAAGEPQVFLKLDWDDGSNPFGPTEVSALALVDGDQALSGRSLHVRRTGQGRYLGATTPFDVKGARDLRIAFVLRAEGMQHVAVNLFDRRRNDNTTPASPAKVLDSDWHPVVFAVEDFHYNSDPPARKIDLETDFASLLFHGREDGPGAQFWLDKLVAYRGRDEQPPQAPGAPRALVGADGAVELTWQESADNTFAAVYNIHRRKGTAAWEKIGESVKPAFMDRPTEADAYTYRITAADFDNNVSPTSPEASALVGEAWKGRIEPAPQWVIDRASYAENVRQVHARGAGAVRRDVFLFAGDSITAAELYTHILGSWLGRGITVRQGVGTVTTEYGAAHIKSYLSEARPEFAIVMYGTNDVDRLSVRDSMRNLAGVVDACVEVGTVPILATIPPQGFDKRRQDGPQRFNRALAELARQKRVPVSYVFEEMMRHDLREMLYDGIHLHPEAGNHAAGRALRQTMDQVYFALRDTSAR